MVMTGEVGRMAGVALAAACNCRGFERAVGGCVVAGSATVVGMDLTGANEGRDGGSVTANAVCRHRGSGRVSHDLHAVVVVVAIEVSGMAGGARAAIAVVGGSVAVAVNSRDQNAVGAGVTGEAGVFVDGCDCIAGMTVDTERGTGDGC